MEVKRRRFLEKRGPSPRVKVNSPGLEGAAASGATAGGDR